MGCYTTPLGAPVAELRDVGPVEALVVVVVEALVVEALVVGASAPTSRGPFIPPFALPVVRPLKSPLSRGRVARSTVGSATKQTARPLPFS